MGIGQAETSVIAQATNTTIQTATTTLNTIIALLMKEKPELKNPEALIIRDEDLEEVLSKFNEEGIAWTSTIQKYPEYKLDDDGNVVLDEKGDPIITGYKEDYARTADGKNHIIMVSGHDRPMVDPETGELVMTEKGNVKMTGGNIDRAAQIRNEVAASRLNDVLKGGNVKQTDKDYTGDYIQLKFPGLESRSRFATELHEKTAISAIIPKDPNDTSLFIRRDAFECNKEGHAPIIDDLLKEYYFMEQFHDYFEYIEDLDARLDDSIMRINRIGAGRDIGKTLIFCDPTKDVKATVEHPIFYIDENGKGHGISEESKEEKDAVFDLADANQREIFISQIQKGGYTYVVDKAELAMPRMREVLALEEVRCMKFKMFQDLLNDYLHDHPEIKEYIDIKHLDNGKSVSPTPDSHWTEIQVHIDNTPIVRNLELDDNPKAKDLIEALREKVTMDINQSLTVRTIDGESIAASLAATKNIDGEEQLKENEIDKKSLNPSNVLDDFIDKLNNRELENSEPEIPDVLETDDDFEPSTE